MSSEDDELDVPRPICRGCGIQAPPGAGNHTLISKRHGWRLMRETDARGVLDFVWRCPACWHEHKERSGQLSGAFSAVIEPPPSSKLRK